MYELLDVIVEMLFFVEDQFVLFIRHVVAFETGGDEGVIKGVRGGMLDAFGRAQEQRWLLEHEGVLLLDL